MNTDQGPYPAPYPVQFAVEYPDRPLNRLTSFFRIFVVIPISIVLGTVSAATWESAGSNSTLHHSAMYYGAGAGGLLFFGPLLMILFRRKYPRWWFDWNLELQRFINRVWTYLALMSDSYPSTDDHQWVQLEYAYPNAATDLNRWLPLVKWLLAIPHYIVLFFLEIGAFFAVIVTWFAILLTGRYPRGIFSFVEGVFRWHNRVAAYAFVLVTDRYPPFAVAQVSARHSPPMTPTRKTALVAGFFYLITFVSIPTLALYGPIKNHRDWILGSAAGPGLAALRSSRLHLPRGCATYQFAPGVSPALAAAAGSALGFVPWSALVGCVRRTAGLALCGQGAACPG